MEQELNTIKATAAEAIEKAVTLDEVEKIHFQYLGRKGALTAILRMLKDFVPEERKTIGAQTHKAFQDIEALIDEKRRELQKIGRESGLKKEWLDVTRPGIQSLRGHLHPITKIIREITAIFSSMGFVVVEGPEVETEYYNFDALNIPAEHPAREMWDTFWLRSNQKEIPNPKSQIPKSKSERLLLRTHTSPVQVRYMEAHNPPIRIVVPGRVYRYEATDAAHDIQFYQLEGLMADKNVSIAHFKAVIQHFFSQLFKTDSTIRLRPSYFPFTEPSFEVDISCISCGGKGCSVCKKSGWLELAGAGMVHPTVFKAAGYNPNEVTGFAFGMGVDRLAMMKYKIPDIRLLRSGDVRFLTQF